MNIDRIFMFAESCCICEGSYLEQILSQTNPNIIASFQIRVQGHSLETGYLIYFFSIITCTYEGFYFVDFIFSLFFKAIFIFYNALICC